MKSVLSSLIMVSVLIFSSQQTLALPGAQPANLTARIRSALQQKMQELYPGAAPVRNVSVDLEHQLCAAGVCKASVSAASNETGIRTTVTLRRLATGGIQIQFLDDIEVE